MSDLRIGKPRRTFPACDKGPHPLAQNARRVGHPRLLYVEIWKLLAEMIHLGGIVDGDVGIVGV
jgi:hypothetical protein